MKRYKRIVFIVLIAQILLILGVNGLLAYESGHSPERVYRVEISRVARELEHSSAEALDLSKYETIKAVREFDPAQTSRWDSAVVQAQGKLYRIEYSQPQGRRIYLWINLLLGAMLVGTLILLVYLGKKLIKPFDQIRELPVQLAKGNLSMPVQEEKSKFFGKFLWGMDMLREKLEDNKARELALHKQKKTLLLSLTHDIKTPLAAIKLYTKAISGELYDTREKRQEALDNIEKNVTYIESYVNEITHAAREDFLRLEVEPGEVYVSSVLEAIGEYYGEKLALRHTQFIMQPQPDCLVKGDWNRLVEVLQNVMENALKYGDGKWIRVSGEDEEDCRLITVANSGSQLQEAELPNLFDSFYRGSNSQGIGGSGLGLYICKKLMQQMDGEVYASLEGGNFSVTVVLRKV